MFKRGMNRRDFLKLSGTVASGALLASCAPAATPAPTQPAAAPTTAAAAPKKNVELKLWLHWGGATLENAQKMIDSYNATAGVQDGIKVVVETVDNNGYRQKMTAARLAGTTPDIYHTSISLLDLVANDVIGPLPDAEQTYVKSSYAQAAVDRLTVNGKVWGYPTEHQAPALIYRKSLFEKAGIKEPPKNTDELRAMAKQLTKTEGGKKTYGYTFWWDGYTTEWHFQSLIWRFGGEFLKFDGNAPGKITLDTPEAAEALNFWRGMVDDGSTQAGEMPIFDAWQNGLGAMTEIEPWFPLIMLRDAGKMDLFNDVGVAPLPPAPGKKGVSVAGGWHVVADSKTKYPAEVAKVMSWMFHKPDMPMSRFIVEQIGSLPAPKDFPLPVKGWPASMNQGFAVETTPITRMSPFTQCIGEQELRATMLKGISKVLLKQADVKPALVQLEKDLNAVLDRTDGARRKK